MAATDSAWTMPMRHAEHYHTIFDFVAGVGLPITEEALPGDTFLPGIAIRYGGLAVDPYVLVWPGDLLHEAGHLAVLPPALRTAADDDLADEADVEHAGELEAMAWAWAAVVELGLPVEVLIHEGGYNGKSRDLLQMYAFGVYPGLQGLCATGMTAAPGFSPEPLTVRYPQMLRWLRE
ncbi:MAG: hypothetical protein KA144_01230 [Xanthomonadaceae bacterium]|nr:hypothetical protein [Xanthomonadaceae bacterium]